MIDVKADFGHYLSGSTFGQRRDENTNAKRMLFLQENSLDGV